MGIRDGGGCQGRRRYAKQGGHELNRQNGESVVQAVTTTTRPGPAPPVSWRRSITQRIRRERNLRRALRLPFAKTQPMGAPASAPKGPGTGTMASRGSGVGEVRAPIRVGGTGGLDPQSALYMEIFQAQNEALRGMRLISLGGPTVIESAITRTAYQQADIIWVMTYGTRPPIRVPGSR